MNWMIRVLAPTSAFTLLVLCTIISAAQAHGVRSRITHGDQAWVAVAVFSDGTPMSYTQVTVTAPDATLPFQKGFSDKNGKFAFVPDRPGKWTVTFQDPMGHRSQASAIISMPRGGKETMAKMPASSGYTSLPTGIKTLIGLCFIMLLALLARTFRRRH